MTAELAATDVRKRGSARRFRPAIAVLLGALLLLWPFIVNHGPFFLSDTTTYIRGADAALHVLGADSEWTDRFRQRYANEEQQSRSRAQPTSEDEGGPPVTLAGRSIYYGALLYVSDRLSGLGLAVFLQSLIAALCLYLTISRFHRGSQGIKPFLLLSATLSVASSLPFFTAYLMPDLFSAIGILAVAHLLIRSPPLSAGTKAFWFAVASWSALTHSSNILMIAIVLGVMVLAAVRWPVSRTGIMLIALAIGVGIAGELAFDRAVQSFTGNPPVRPPFLTARLVADGPGKAYLEHSCPGSGFTLCRHMSALSAYSDSFLWSEDTKDGVFSVVSNDERRRIANEELRFVGAVFADRPLDVLGSSASSIWDQARKWSLSEFNQTPGEAAELLAKLPPQAGRQQAHTLAYRHAMPVRATEILSVVTALIGLVALVWAVARGEMERNMRIFIAVLLVGIAADIIVCGAISTPHDRYSMRVLWLIPVGAFVALMGIRRIPRRHGLAP